MDKETRKVLGFIALAMCFILPYSLITGATIYDAVCVGAYNRFSIGNAVVLVFNGVRNYLNFYKNQKNKSLDLRNYRIT